jgi:hypothetical protein
MSETAQEQTPTSFALMSIRSKADMRGVLSRRPRKPFDTCLEPPGQMTALSLC